MIFSHRVRFHAKELSMLVEFSVGNYRSFKEKVTLSMVAANIASKPESLDHENVFNTDLGVKLLTSAAVH